MSVKRSLLLVGVLVLLANAVQAQQPSGMIQIPVCQIEVTWERLSTADSTDKSRATDVWLWGMGVDELPTGVNPPVVSPYGRFSWDNEHKDVLSQLGPIDVYDAPTSTNPWAPNKPVLLFNRLFLQTLDLQIFTRTLRLLNFEFGGGIWGWGEEKTEQQIQCPPEQEESVGTITQIWNEFISHSYTYKLIIKVVGTKSIPALHLSDE